MQIWQLTDIEFHGSLSPIPGPDTQFSDLVGGDINMLLTDVDAAPSKPLPHALGYEYKLASGRPLGEATLVVFDAAGTPVAGKVGPTIMVDKAHRRKRLGPGMIIALYHSYNWAPGTAFEVSELGARAMRRAHAIEVVTAYLAGEAVPPHVRAIYNLP